MLVRPEPQEVAVSLLVQVLYKVTTPLAVDHPLVCVCYLMALTSRVGMNGIATDSLCSTKSVPRRFIAFF